MNRQFWKQFLIALVLFLLGYFTFNSKLFAAELPPVENCCCRLKFESVRARTPEKISLNFNQLKTQADRVVFFCL
jgi:hypothetical protein